MELRVFLPEFTGFVSPALQECAQTIRKLTSDFVLYFGLDEPTSARTDRYADINETVGMKIRGSLSLEMKIRTETQFITLTDAGHELKFPVEEWVKSPLGKITQNYNSIIARARPILQGYHIPVQPIVDALHTDARCSIDKKIAKASRSGFIFSGVTAEYDKLVVHSEASAESTSRSFISFCLEGKFRQIQELFDGDLRLWAIELHRVLQKIELNHHSSRSSSQSNKKQAYFGVLGGYPTFIRRFMDSCVGLDAYVSPPAIANYQSLIYTAYRQGFSICHAFSVLIVRHARTHDYLTVLENGGRGWWIPGGHVENGESLQQAALRECIEESGMHVVLKGVLAIEFVPKRCEVRLRVVFYAEPANEIEVPKSQADEHSLKAEWVSVGWIRDMDMRTKRAVVDNLNREDVFRGFELSEWSQYIEDGGKIHDLSIIDGLSDSYPTGLSEVESSSMNRSDDTSPTSDCFSDIDLNQDFKVNDGDDDDEEDDDDSLEKQVFKMCKNGQHDQLSNYLRSNASQSSFADLMNYRNKKGWNVLHAAIKSLNMTSIQLMLGICRPEDLMEQNNKQRTPLHFIIRHVPKDRHSEVLGLALLRLPSRDLRLAALQMKDDEGFAICDILRNDDGDSQLKQFLQLV